jgi:hypothetical protein
MYFKVPSFCFDKIEHRVQGKKASLSANPGDHRNPMLLERYYRRGVHRKMFRRGVSCPQKRPVLMQFRVRYRREAYAKD